MKITGTPLDEATKTLGEAGEAEFTFLVLPAVTYGLIAEQAKKEGSTAAKVFEKAVLQYLRQGDSKASDPVAEVRPQVQPAFVLRKRR